MYEGRRSSSLLKIKTFYDAEAVVTGYAPGKGRNKGSTGALMCRMESGKVRVRCVTLPPYGRFFLLLAFADIILTFPRACGVSLHLALQRRLWVDRQDPQGAAPNWVHHNVPFPRTDSGRSAQVWVLCLSEGRGIY